MTQSFNVGAYLEWDDGILSFDVVTSETVELNSTATEFPVESGANISDHVRENADKLTLEVVVSNTPITEHNFVDETLTRGGMGALSLIYDSPPPQHNLMALLKGGLGALKDALFGAPDPPKAALLLFDNPFSATKETFDLLKKLRSEVTLLHVASRDWSLRNMIIETISEPRQASDGSCARFTIGMKKLRIVETRQTIAAVPAEPRAKGKVDAGKKGGTDIAGKKATSLAAAGSDFSGLSKLLGIAKPF